MTSDVEPTSPKLPGALVPAPPGARIALALRFGRMQLATYAKAHGLTLRQAASVLDAQSQVTRRASACMRAPDAP